MSASTSGAKSAPGAASQHSTRPVSPDARRASASAPVATPSQSAPAARAARATGTMPCP